MDLSSNEDLSALAFFFPEICAVYVRFYIPKENMIEREKRDKVPFLRWVRDGWVTATPGNVIDTDYIRAEANRLAEIFDVREIAFDKKFAVTIVTQLQADGFTMVNVPQTALSLTAACRELEKHVISHRLWHGGNPVLQWMALNVCVETDATEGIRPSKAASYERIDGISATVMAVARAIVQPEKQSSVYEQRGLTTL